jgi:hypothetical protein
MLLEARIERITSVDASEVKHMQYVDEETVVFRGSDQQTIWASVKSFCDGRINTAKVKTTIAPMPNIDKSIPSWISYPPAATELQTDHWKKAALFFPEPPPIPTDPIPNPQVPLPVPPPTIPPFDLFQLFITGWWNRIPIAIFGDGCKSPKHNFLK